MISIIVPVYNIENYLKPCLDSILNSTYQDFEMILVDDGSKDGSGAICDIYADKDHRVRVIHQVNAGVSAARNKGMKVSKGDYIMFVDGDDLIHSKMIEVLYNAIEEGDYDFSMIYARVVPDELFDKNILHDEFVVAHGVVLTQKDYLENRCSASMQYHSVCNKLYKKSLIADIEFMKTGAEDMEWNNRMCMYMNQAILIENELYYYIQRGSSETHSGVTKLFVDRINSALLCLDAIPVDNKYYRALCLRFLYKMMFYIRYTSKNSELYSVAKANCRNAYKKTKSELMRSPFISANKKLRIVFNYHFPFIFNTVQDLIIKHRQ